MTYTVAELIAELEQLPEDAEVRLAFQPRWPFEHSISEIHHDDGFAAAVEAACIPGVDVKEDGSIEIDPEMSDKEQRETQAKIDAVEETASEQPGIVYLAEGRQIGYLPSAVTSALGWGKR